MAITFPKNMGLAWTVVMAFKASCAEKLHFDIAISGVKMHS